MFDLIGSQVSRFIGSPPVGPTTGIINQENLLKNRKISVENRGPFFSSGTQNLNIIQVFIILVTFVLNNSPAAFNNLLRGSSVFFSSAL